MTKTTQIKKQSATIQTPAGEKQIVPMQLGLLEDIARKTIQQRFEEFCHEAVHALAAARDDGEPIFDCEVATPPAAEITIKVKISRVANDSMMFSALSEVKQKLPNVPFRQKSSVYTSDVGLVMKATPDQFPLFDPAGGQPQPASVDEAAEILEDE